MISIIPAITVFEGWTENLGYQSKLVYTVFIFLVLLCVGLGVRGTIFIGPGPCIPKNIVNVKCGLKQNNIGRLAKLWSSLTRYWVISSQLFCTVGSRTALHGKQVQATKAKCSTCIQRQCIAEDKKMDFTRISEISFWLDYLLPPLPPPSLH